MESDQSFGLPSSGADLLGKPDEIMQLSSSPITGEEANDSPFEEDDSGGDSGFHTDSDPASDDSDHIDRGAASAQTMGILSRYAEISMNLLEWSRIFIEENPEMLSGPSTILKAYPDREKSHAELHRGASAVCRIITDKRLEAVRGWATKLEREWLEALAKKEEVCYSDFIDLMYSEASRIVEGGEGAHRDERDVQTVAEVFGFAPEPSEGSAEEEGPVSSEEVAGEMEG